MCDFSLSFFLSFSLCLFVYICVCACVCVCFFVNFSFHPSTVTFPDLSLFSSSCQIGIAYLQAEGRENAETSFKESIQHNAHNVKAMLGLATLHRYKQEFSTQDRYFKYCKVNENVIHDLSLYLLPYQIAYLVISYCMRS